MKPRPRRGIRTKNRFQNAWRRLAAVALAQEATPRLAQMNSVYGLRHGVGLLLGRQLPSIHQSF